MALANGNLKRETESLLSTAQEQTLTPTRLEKCIIRMCQINAVYVEQICKIFCKY